MKRGILITTLLCIVFGTACRSADMDPPGDGDDVTKSDDSWRETTIENVADNDEKFESKDVAENEEEIENEDEEEIEYLVAYDCKTDDSNSCDKLVCGFKRTMKDIQENSLSYDPALSEATRTCLASFDECLGEECPPGSEASSWKDTRTCSSELSSCLTVSAPLGIWSISYQKLDLMAAPSPSVYRGKGCPNVFRDCGYTFADSEYNGEEEGDSEIDISGELCVEGVASQEKDGQDAVYWGAGLGTDLRWHDIGEHVDFEYMVDQFIGVTFDIEGYWGDELRVLFHEYDSNESAYVVVPPNAVHVTAMVDHADVWYDPGNMVDRRDLDAIQFHVATNPQAPTPFDFCVLELYMLFREPPADS